MLNLYHGSIYDFKCIDATKGKPYKDFGVGFYTTSSIKHADSIARRNQRLYRVMTVYRYNLELDLDACKQDIDFNLRVFDKPDIAWLDFIVSNRSNAAVPGFHNYDLVIGPTADMNTSTLIKYAFEEAERKGRTYLTDEEKLDLIRDLEPDKLDIQYCFCTNKAVAKGYLRFKAPQWRVFL